MPFKLPARWLHGLAACAVALFALLALAFAQTADPPAKRLDQARGQLDQIEAALSRPGQNDVAMQALRAQLDPVVVLIEGVIAEVTPKAAAVQSRLDQLKPKTPEKPADKAVTDKPADKQAEEPAPAEDTSVANERAEQEKLFKELDGTLRRARALEVETQQTINLIQERRRNLFTRALFEQSSSLFRPGLWSDVLSGLPRDWRAAQTIGSDWLSSATRKLEGWRLPVLAALILTLLVLVWPVFIVAWRVASRRAERENPTRLQNVLAACLVGVIIVSLPVVLLVAMFGIASWFELTGGPMRTLMVAFAEGIVRVALISGLAIALFGAPRPDWRLLPGSGARANILLRMAITVAAVVSISKLFSAGADLIGAELPLIVALRGTGALIAALVLWRGLNSLSRESEGQEAGTAAGRRGLQGPLRLLIWLVVLAVLCSVVIGYIALAVFLLDQIVWIFAVAAALYLLLALAEEGIPALLEPVAAAGRALVSAIGMRHDSLRQMAILLTGAVQMAMYGVAGLLVLAPWGVQSDDFAGTLRTAFFGFKVGEVSVSPSNIIIALLLFGLALVFTRAIQQWLELRFLPHTQLDRGLRNSIRTSLGYLGFVVAAGLGLSHLGLGFEKLAIVAGALSVGIGFGLQSIVNNFVSGLILLWERAIQVGDWVVVGEDQGYVRRINVRSTEIETFERSTVIVPNSNLVSGVVKNWLRHDRIGRIKIDLKLNAGADVEVIRELLVAAAREQDTVIKIPAPMVLFADLLDTGVKLELICFVEDVEMAARVRSDLLFELYKTLGERNLTEALVNTNAGLAGLKSLLQPDAPAPAKTS